ncbi:MAG TPA: protein translocase subunit SecD [Motilibacteraceae bacterium]|nr:protein translocase subunit SecD [Motilibacteraceae bacterium]
MAAPQTGSRPGRALGVLAGIVVVIYVLIFFAAPGSVAGKALSFADKYQARLGLDLEGGTQIDLIPKVADGQQGKITNESIDQAVSILRKRVDSFGVSEAEITKQGSGSNQTILISIPGTGNEQILNQVQQTAELRFRQVLAAASGAPAPTATPSGSGAATPSATASGASTAKASPSPSTTNAGAAVPQALRQQSSPSPSASASAAPSSSAAPTPTPTSSAPASTTPQIPAEVQQKFAQLDCTKPQPENSGVDPVDQVIAACGRNGLKYILGPALLVGTDVSGASASPQVDRNGNPIGGWQVNLNFTGGGTKKFADATTKINVSTEQSPQDEIAIVLDGQVVSAPSINEPIVGGSAQITGDFTQAEATDLANVLKYGALPLSFQPGAAQEVSPTLGAASLRGGLIAGGLGLALVVLYMLVYYRRLGLVAAASLAVAGVLTWGLVVLLGWRIGFRLSLAGIAGLIVSIGITADSFIVYFERLRDEVREGRSVRVAAEAGWKRARHTIVVSDIVSLLAAVVLYILSTASVRGFAFTLGLTTLVDLLVVFLFTKPLVTLAARSRSFASGRFSGLDPARLGAKPQSAASPSLAMARARERRAAAEARAGAGSSSSTTGEEA